MVYKVKNKITAFVARPIPAKPAGIINTPTKINYIAGNNVASKENSALSIGRNGISANLFPLNLPSPNFDDVEWIEYIKQGNPGFNPLREVQFSPASQLNVNSFSNSIGGTKLLPVYEVPLYRGPNQITF